jgi:hypothetical protein
MDDISTSKELFPAWNPKGLRVMFPPEVCIGVVLCVWLEIKNLRVSHGTFLSHGQDLFAATMDAMGITNKDQVGMETWKWRGMMLTNNHGCSL